MEILLASTITITLALVFYSIGVWAERFSRILKPWHLYTFWAGFVFDLTGTVLMHVLAQEFDPTDPHAITGQLALWLMLAHAIWATIVVRRNIDKWKQKFHRYSLVVWLIWLIPYVGGMLMAM